MATQLTNGQVDRVERRLRQHEHDLESTGRDICDAQGGAEAWSAINDALQGVRNAIRECWRMRPLGLLLAALCAVYANAGESFDTRDTDALLDAIAQVESDRGATSPNVYQIRRIYFRDCQRIWKGGGVDVSKYKYETCVKDAATSRRMISGYWRYYGEQYQRATGKPVTAEVLARIHNGGPGGWKKRATLAYWRRVRKHFKPGKRVGK